MNEAINSILLDLLYACLIALVPVAIAGVRAFAKYATEYFVSKTRSEQASSIIVDVTKFATDAVTYTMQTYVDTLKAQGKFDADAQEIAFQKSFSAAKSFISDEYRELFESVYGNLDDYLKIVIEAKVQELKLTKGTK